MSTPTRSDWIGPQPDDPKPIIYLSGIVPAPLTVAKLIELTGYRYYCLSYTYCAKGAPRFDKQQGAAIELHLKQPLRICVDSGAHTFHELAYNKMGTRGSTTVSRLERRHEIETQVFSYAKAYAKWVNTFPAGTFDFYVNLDYVIHAPTIYKMQHRLEDKLSIRPIPVYHGDHDTSWLQRYYDEGHRLVGIGLNPTVRGHGNRRRYYDKVFEFATAKGLSLHGFGCTGPDAFAYPWYSVDSATWVKAAGMGSILAFYEDSQGRPKIRTRYVSERGLPKELQQGKDLEDAVAEHGFKLKDLHVDRSARILYNVMSFKRASEQFQARQSRINWKNRLC